MYPTVQIINGEANDPPHPFVIVNRYGMHVDLDPIVGQLWDKATVAEITWGNRSVEGRRYGVVKLKNGTGRTFSDPELIEPYIKAWKVAKANADLKEAMRKAT
jgi:hypothetical protein